MGVGCTGVGGMKGGFGRFGGRVWEAWRAGVERW